MELSGDEKRIQTLFFELSFEDQSGAPRFEKLWKSAEAVGRAPVPRFTMSVAAITCALVIATAAALVVWSWYKPLHAPAQNTVGVAPQTISTPTAYGPHKTEKPAFAANPRRLRPARQKRSARQQQTDRAITQRAAILASWQSPTRSFMDQPAGFALNSLPALDQSAKDLQLFLSTNNDVIKEPNQ